ncbi:MAG: restriction endonuclease, partial [Candidatus Latescibacterota bacterium]
DPFCGCGTSISVAEKLHRKWIGIDITYLAINLIENRLRTACRLEDGHGSGEQNLSPYEVIGVPKDFESARALAERDKHEFEYWSIGMVGARPQNDKRKKGADQGIDGVLLFFDDESNQAKKIIVQVKGGHVNRAHIATLKGDMEREKAVIGVLITLLHPTRPMRDEASSAGFYTAPDGTLYPRIQILTAEDLFVNKKIEYPKYKANVSLQKAPRKSKTVQSVQLDVFEKE